jgi:hypothetical protein
MKSQHEAGEEGAEAAATREEEEGEAAPHSGICCRSDGDSQSSGSACIA